MTWLGRAVRLIPVVILFVLATSCNDFFVSNSAIQSVAVTPSAVLLKAAASSSTPGDSYQLASASTTVGGTTADDTQSAAWSSSSTDVSAGTSGTTPATVPGLITAVGTTATPNTSPINITAKGGTVTSNTCSVLLYVVPTPQSLTVTAPDLATAGAAAGTYQFHAYLGPDATYPDVTNFVTWSSDTASAATVVANTGVVTVLSVVTPTSVNIKASAAVGATPTATSPVPVTGTLPFTAD